MVTLQIEHPITDFDVWCAAYARFADARERAGVRHHLVRRPEDDSRYVVVDLEFDDVAAAHAFEHLLRTTVWTRPEASPALDGTPVTRVLVAAPMS